MCLEVSKTDWQDGNRRSEGKRGKIVMRLRSTEKNKTKQKMAEKPEDLNNREIGKPNKVPELNKCLSYFAGLHSTCLIF